MAEICLLLDIEIQMAWEFQFSRQDLLIYSKWIVIKERWIPADRNKCHLQPTLQAASARLSVQMRLLKTA